MLEIKEFSPEEFRRILKSAVDLVRRGYISGINLIKSEKTLPKESVVVHFLHDSKKHVDYVRSRLQRESLEVPRFTFYSLSPKYFDKSNFEEEYREALFFDEEFRDITLDIALSKKEGTSVARMERDLLIPLDAQSLEITVNTIRQSDSSGPEPWLDPVIIIKTKNELPTLPGFINRRPYVNLRKTCEEFYSILTDEIRAEALKRYLRKLCEATPKIGELDEHSVAFDISQINQEFLDYMLKRIRLLKTLE